MPKDDLDRSIAELKRKHPDLPALMKAVRRRQRFGRLLAKHREQLGISQRAIAAKMKTSTTIVSRVELGVDVQLSTLEKYVAALGKNAIPRAHTRGRQVTCSDHQRDAHSFNPGKAASVTLAYCGGGWVSRTAAHNRLASNVWEL
jgi:hypothetical protein